MTSGLRRTITAVALVGAAAFLALTVLVSTSSTHGVDADAFALARDVREPWLDHAARALTELGLFAVAGPVVLIGAGLLHRGGQSIRAIVLVAGAGLTWGAVWMTKWAVDRPRPPASLVHTFGQSFPSSHAANAVGWFALAIALTALVGSRGARAAIVAAGAVLALLIGLSRIYLRAHYATDVIAGASLAATMYALAVLAAVAAGGRRATATPRECDR